ncbi:MAG: aspartate aminotransferase family protein [Bacteroidia bacterium]|nr:aspartate aminotransferase family protein [Bacteroidia bacterium]
MNYLLENDHKNINTILSQVQSVAVEYIEKQRDLPPGKFVKDISLSDLPQLGISANGALDFFVKHYANHINNSAGPRYFGFVTGGSTPASIAGDWLVSAFDQNACGSNDSIAPQLERQTLHFLKQLIGLDESYFGSFVTGATMSNFVSLAIARQWVGEQQGIDVSNEGLQALPYLKVVSSTAHSSIIKSLSMLGMGRNALVKINIQPDREAIDLKELEEYLKQNQASTLIVVANAGTVNTVDFDDLEGIGQLKQKYNFWLHVDAAFGGFAATSPKFDHLMKGINHADSITIDAHKWLNVPYDAAMQLTKHKSLQPKVFQNSAAYLGDPTESPDFFHYTPENSRRFRALPSWFTLMAYGKQGYQEIVERNCSCASFLGSMLESSDEFKLLSPVRMNVVCFTLNKENPSSASIAAFLARIRDDGRTFFTPTNYKGTPAIRAAFSNWQTTEADVAITFQALKDNY